MTIEQDTLHARCHPEDFLPFISDVGGELHYWTPIRAGDPHIDHCIGVIYALYTLEYLKRHQKPEIARGIMQSMPETHGKVEEGFVDAISEYIATGAVSLSGFDIRL